MAKASRPLSRDCASTGEATLTATTAAMRAKVDVLSMVFLLVFRTKQERNAPVGRCGENTLAAPRSVMRITAKRRLDVRLCPASQRVILRSEYPESEQTYKLEVRTSRRPISDSSHTSCRVQASASK